MMSDVMNAPVVSRGRDGRDGRKGERGEQGAPGQDGRHGRDGKDGKDAVYALAVLHGFKGTEADWLESWRGKDGALGPQGKAGVPGKDGLRGDQGPQGVPGNDGARGPKGDKGERGEAGAAILHGEGPPTESLGRIDDFYIDTTAYLLYGPKTSKGWGLGIRMRGRDGRGGGGGSTSSGDDSGGGGGTISPSFIDAEVPSGVIDGVNAAFTLSSSPSPALSLRLFRNGVLQQAGADYTLAGATITYVAAPASDDTHISWYRVAGAGPAFTYVDAETPVGLVDDVNTVFALSSAPSPATSLQLFRNGVVQTAGGDFTLAGSTVTYVTAPGTGDTHGAFYRY